MTKKNKKLLIIIPVVCFILIAGVLCGIFVPQLLKKETRVVNLVKGEHESVDFGTGFKEYVKTENASLYVDKKSGAVAITDSNNKVVFNSHSDSAAKSKLASVVSVTLRDKVGNSYIKSSTDNSAEEGGLKVTSKEKNTVTLTFNFIEDRVGNVTETLSVKFSEQNGGIKAEIDLSQAILPEGYCIEKISVLPGLFSENKPEEKTFYTIPDGCGAQVDLTKKINETYAHTFDVYGSDITFSEYSQGAVLPCFVMTKNNVLVTAVIDDGDALSSVYIKRNKNGGGNLYNTFVVTPFGKVNGKLVKGASYDGVISQIYYVSTTGDRNYNAVSSIVRDNLTNKGYLPSKMSDAFVDYPFFITAIGSENGKKNDVYTSFENASEMIALLKTRGVRSIALRFAGAGKNGLNSGAKNSDKISDVLGGEKAYNKLCKVANENNSSSWLDINIALNTSDRGSNKTDAYPEFREYLAKESKSSNVVGYNYAYSNISQNYKMVSKLESANVCINDLSSVLYTDVLGKINRQDALKSLSEKVQVFGVNGNLMLTNPAVYLMSQADAVFNATQSAALEEYEGVTAVPLLQMVLHGSICYGSEPINLFEDSKDALLKAVEYGASPAFVFTYDKCNVLDYGVYATQTSKFYSSAKRMLPLMDMKITSHEQVVSGVYKITYDYSKVVYVNYNPSVVEVNGILVSAKDFVII